MKAKLSLNKIQLLGYLFYISVILTHVLVLLDIIPYSSVNGARTPSYDAQIPLSISSMTIGFLGIIYIFIVGKLKKRKIKLVFCITTWMLTVYWTIGLVMQLLGTTFERFVLSWIVLFAVFVHVQLALSLQSKEIKSEV